MPDPSRYEPSYDFSAYQENNPDSPLPAVQVDVQLADIGTSTTELRDAIKDVRRSDGALMNGIVTEDSLADGLIETLTAATGADAVAEDAAEAAASAAAAAASELILETIADLLGDGGGFFADYGSITDAAASASDYGSIA